MTHIISSSFVSFQFPIFSSSGLKSTFLLSLILLFPTLLLPTASTLPTTSSPPSSTGHSTPRRPNGFSVLVTGAADFVGTHCSLALNKCGYGVLSLDNFNSYYEPSLKRAPQNLPAKHQIFIDESDLNDAQLLAKLFGIFPFTHVLHLTARWAGTT